MKDNKIILILLVVVCLLTLIVFSTIFVNNSSKQDDVESVSLVNTFVSSVNNKDIDSYISLFTESLQNEMEEHLNHIGNDTAFFKENNIELISVTKISTDLEMIDTTLSPDEFSDYEDIAVYYAELYTELNNNEATTTFVKSGYDYKIFVTVKEAGKWKLHRILTLNEKPLIGECETFSVNDDIEGLL